MANGIYGKIHHRARAGKGNARPDQLNALNPRASPARQTFSIPDRPLLLETPDKVPQTLRLKS